MTTSLKTPTPRTEAEIKRIITIAGWDGHLKAGLIADFARKLETELQFKITKKSINRLDKRKI